MKIAKDIIDNKQETLANSKFIDKEYQDTLREDLSD